MRRSVNCPEGSLLENLSSWMTGRPLWGRDVSTQMRGWGKGVRESGEYLRSSEVASSKKKQRTHDRQCFWDGENEERCGKRWGWRGQEWPGTQYFLEQVKSLGFIPSEEKPLKVWGGWRGMMKGWHNQICILKISHWVIRLKRDTRGCEQNF